MLAKKTKNKKIQEKKEKTLNGAFKSGTAIIGAPGATK